MFKLFTTVASVFIIVGIVLFVLSFSGSLSIWYGIEIVKSGVYLFIMGLFMQLVEDEFRKRKSEENFGSFDLESTGNFGE